MRFISLILASVLFSVSIAGYLKPKGSPCPQGDGLYSVGCSQFYLQCVNGIEYERTCPEGLYFDRLLSRCERRANNHACTETKKDFANVRQKAFFIDCKSRKNGDYAIEKNICDENYYQCSNEIGYMRKCPFNQYFSPTTKRCDYYENCRSTIAGKYTKDYANAYASQYAANDGSKVEVVEENGTGIDCSRLGNATITIDECSQVYWMCANYKLFKKYCPTGLVYDKDEDLCNHRNFVKGCAEFTGASTTTPPAPSEDISATYNGTLCQGKDDGFYPLETCSNKFVSCNGGVSREIPCADNLVFDVRINACDYPEACKSERKVEEIPALFTHGGSAMKNHTDVPVDFDCSDKEDGLYVKDKCSTKYVQCNDRTAFWMTCPANLVFNMATKTCDYLDNCDKQVFCSCTKINNYCRNYVEARTTQIYTTTTSMKTPIVTSTVSYENIVDNSAPAPPPAQEEAVGFSCEKLENGLYAVGLCKPQFHQCWNRRHSTSNCPSPLIFNPYTGQCDYRNNVADCNGVTIGVPTYTPTSTAKTLTTTTSTTAAPQSAYKDVATTIVYAPIDPFCERLADGNYGVGCNQYFYQCESFETKKVKCPAGLYYNRVKHLCDFRDQIPECNPNSTYKTTQPPTTTTATYSTGNAAPAPPPSQKTHTPSADGKFSCVGRVDGIYALPYCTSDYVQCINGQALVSQCATGLVYSENSGLCDYRENVENCNSSGSQAADSIPNEACAGKTDGYYSNGCSPHYYSCIGEKIRKMSCPAKLRFSTAKGVCDYPGDVAECGLSSQPIQTPPVADSSLCVNKINGLHSFKRCSPHYVVCENGIATTGTCAAPLVFNGATELCDYKSNQPECSENSENQKPY
ncbi:unnamed protein product [Caenorhabditis bovis]|uniref:Chitin-binding type-2 domain-containing protein n=1 Tax=Caenorhabditis bovis TaxID=2654633 RepID=A0A8S1EG27_9PELO|nr:unnamed protein product [Caenorhabditis bovis]